MERTFLFQTMCVFLPSFLPHPPSTITFLLTYFQAMCALSLRMYTIRLNKWKTALKYSGHAFTHVILLVPFSANFFCQIAFVTHHCFLHCVFSNSRSLSLHIISLCCSFKRPLNLSLSHKIFFTPIFSPPLQEST